MFIHPKEISPGTVTNQPNEYDQRYTLEEKTFSPNVSVEIYIQGQWVKISTLTQTQKNQWLQFRNGG